MAFDFMALLQQPGVLNRLLNPQALAEPNRLVAPTAGMQPPPPAAGPVMQNFDARAPMPLEMAGNRGMPASALRQPFPAAPTGPANVGRPFEMPVDPMTTAAAETAPPRPVNTLSLPAAGPLPEKDAAKISIPNDPDKPSYLDGFKERLQDAMLGWSMGGTMQESLGMGAKMIAARKQERAGQNEKNQTIEWLKSKGMDPEQARITVAGGPAVLNDAIRQITQGNMPEWDVREVGGNLVRFDKRGAGGVQTIYDGSDARPMTADEKARWGIPADDRRPYYLDGGKPQVIGGNGGVNVNVGAEKGYDKTVGEGYGKRFLDLQEGAQSANKALSALTIMENSLNGPGFYSGTGAGAVANLKRIGSSLGLDSEGISSIETFNAMSKQAALESMGGSLGAGFSNADRGFVEMQVPNLANTPEGNRALIGIQRKLATRRQEIANLARQYAETTGGGRIDAGFDSYLAKWSEQNPLFPQGRGNTGRGAGSEVGRQRARNPSTGEVMEWDGNQWRPAR